MALFNALLSDVFYISQEEQHTVIAVALRYALITSCWNFLDQVLLAMVEAFLLLTENICGFLPSGRNSLPSVWSKLKL